MRRSMKIQVVFAVLLIGGVFALSGCSKGGPSKKAGEIDEGRFTQAYGEAQQFARRGDHAKAIAMYQKAEKLAADDQERAIVYKKLAESYRATGDAANEADAINFVLKYSQNKQLNQRFRLRLTEIEPLKTGPNSDADGQIRIRPRRPDALVLTAGEWPALTRSEKSDTIRAAMLFCENEAIPLEGKYVNVYAAKVDRFIDMHPSMAARPVNDIFLEIIYETEPEGRKAIEFYRQSSQS